MVGGRFKTGHDEEWGDPRTDSRFGDRAAAGLLRWARNTGAPRTAARSRRMWHASLNRSPNVRYHPIRHGRSCAGHLPGSSKSRSRFEAVWWVAGTRPAMTRSVVIRGRTIAVRGPGGGGPVALGPQHRSVLHGGKVPQDVARVAEQIPERPTPPHTSWPVLCRPPTGQ